MAVSSSYDYSMNCQEIVKEALYDLGAIAPGETPTADEIVSGRRKLNVMLKGWQAQNIGLWLLQEVTLVLQNDVVKYTLGPTGDGHCSATMNKTELAVAAAAADGTITVDSDSAISDADIIGIELDSSTVDWDVVNGAPAANVVTLTGTINTAAAIDNHVYSYTSLTQRPLAITEARRRDADNNDIPVDIVSRSEYMAQVDKTSEGAPSLIYYQPTLTNGTLYVWPEPDDTKVQLVMTIARPIMDFDANTDDADFPVEWLEPVISNLALRLAPQYGATVHPELKNLAHESLFWTKGFDREDVSIFFQPDFD